MLGVRLDVRGAAHASRPLLIASNHCSWLDIVVLSAVMPVSFVAKSEVGQWPGIGRLARLQRTIFVDRRKRSQTGATTAEIGRRLSGGDAVVLFAEGTSSDHNRVLAFRPALLGAAGAALAQTDAGPVFVQPVSIAYPRRHGLPLRSSEKPQIAWYGGMTLANHLWDMLKSGGPEAVVAFGTPIPVTQGADRKQIAAQAEHQVRALTIAALRGTSPILSGGQTG